MPPLVSCCEVLSEMHSFTRRNSEKMGLMCAHDLIPLFSILIEVMHNTTMGHYGKDSLHVGMVKLN